MLLLRSKSMESEAKSQLVLNATCHRLSKTCLRTSIGGKFEEFNTHTQNLNSYNVFCLFTKKVLKSQYRFFSCQNRNLELSIDILFVWEVFPSDAVGVHKKYFAKLVQNPNLLILHQNKMFFMEALSNSDNT